ncbi:MAG TPA: flagellar protein FlgN [Nitrospiraceae bacterium]|nr:flagellar protein FlgN [Nitrospiraceae bacterium]
MPDESAASLQLGPVLDLMLEKVREFHDLLKDEQQAIRTLSFGQFSDVTERKSNLLDSIRALEQSRRRLVEDAPNGARPLSTEVDQRQQALIELIGATDRLNRLNAALIGQSLEFLQGSLSLWQHSSASAPLYSQSGSVVGGASRGVGIKG